MEAGRVRPKSRASASSARAIAQRGRLANDFARALARGDLPIVQVEDDAARAEWSADIGAVDAGTVLPLLLHGIHAEELNHRIVAEGCALELVEAHAASVVGLLPRLIVPLKACLNTRDPDVVVRTLRLLQALALCPGAGNALVEYHRQLLPALNIFSIKLAARGRVFDPLRPGLSDTLQETLELLEAQGGDAAAESIVRFVPTYVPVLGSPAAASDA